MISNLKQSAYLLKLEGIKLSLKGNQADRCSEGGGASKENEQNQLVEGKANGMDGWLVG